MPKFASHGRFWQVTFLNFTKNCWILLVLAWISPCHAYMHMWDRDSTDGECCGSHVTLLPAPTSAPIIKQGCSTYQIIEEQPAPRIFPSCIFHPPQA